MPPRRKIKSPEAADILARLKVLTGIPEEIRKCIQEEIELEQKHVAAKEAVRVARNSSVPGNGNNGSDASARADQHKAAEIDSVEARIVAVTNKLDEIHNDLKQDKSSAASMAGDRDTLRLLRAKLEAAQIQALNWRQVARDLKDVASSNTARIAALRSELQTLRAALPVTESGAVCDTSEAVAAALPAAKAKVAATKEAGGKPAAAATTFLKKLQSCAADVDAFTTRTDELFALIERNEKESAELEAAEAALREHTAVVSSLKEEIAATKSRVDSSKGASTGSAVNWGAAKAQFEKLKAERAALLAQKRELRANVSQAVKKQSDAQPKQKSALKVALDARDALQQQLSQICVGRALETVAVPASLDPETVQAIEVDYGVLIVINWVTTDGIGSPCASIRGSVAAVGAAAAALRDVAAAVRVKTERTTQHFDVPNAVDIKRIIGKGAVTINSLSARSGASLFVKGTSVEMTGTAAQISVARQLLEEVLDQHATETVGVPPSLADVINGKRREFLSPIQNESGASRVAYDVKTSSIQIAGSKPSVVAAKEAVDSLLGTLLEGHRTINVDSSAVPVIIGPAGKTVKDLESTYGVVISVADAAGGAASVSVFGPLESVAETAEQIVTLLRSRQRPSCKLPYPAPVLPSLLRASPDGGPCILEQVQKAHDCRIQADRSERVLVIEGNKADSDINAAMEQLSAHLSELSGPEVLVPFPQVLRSHLGKTVLPAMRKPADGPPLAVRIVGNAVSIAGPVSQTKAAAESLKTAIAQLENDITSVPLGTVSASRIIGPKGSVVAELEKNCGANLAVDGSVGCVYIFADTHDRRDAAKIAVEEAIASRTSALSPPPSP